MTKSILTLCAALLAVALPHLVFSQKNNSSAQPSPLSANLQAYLARATENGYAGSVLVAVKGDILLEQGYGMADREAKRPQTAETVFSVGSITKQFTAAAIMKLWSQSKLQLDDPLSKYFPEAPADKAAMTLHQLLTHTAGFPGAIGDDYENLDAAQFARLAFSTKLDNPPGAAYQYSNVGYSLLGIIVERVSGLGYERFLREQLWLPAGMKRTGYVLPGFSPGELAVGYQGGNRWGTALDRPWLPDGPGWHLRANGGVLSTVGDMHRWYKALKTNVVLPKNATEKMFTPHTAEGPRGLSFYGYGWVVQDDGGQRTIWHNGGNGVYNAFMGFDLANDVCIVVSSNSNDKVSDRFALNIQKMLAGGGGLLDEAVVKRAAGQYRLPSGATFSLRIDENNRLTTAYDDQKPLLLFASDGSERPEETAAVGDRTFQMLDGVRKGDFALLAKYRGVSLETAQQRIKPFWEDMQAERGRIASIELMGVVARPKLGLMLAFVKVNFEKKPLYFMYVWKGENIQDVQEMEVMDKVFEWRNSKADAYAPNFYAANNNRSVVLENATEGTPVLLIKHPKGDVRAVRVGDLPVQAAPPPAATPGGGGEEPYRNSPVTNAIYKAILEKGAAHFSQNSRQILTEAGFDFDNDMQLLGVGERLEEAKKWDEGIALFEAYTQIFPRIVVAWNRLGKCREAKGDKAGARAAWEKSVALRPKNNPAAEWLKG